MSLLVIPRRNLSGTEGYPCWAPCAEPDGHCDLWCGRGHVSLLAKDQHTVAADGTVSPSLVCPRKGCDWHVFGRLEGWPEV
jgi:hypothetical protein